MTEQFIIATLAATVASGTPVSSLSVTGVLSPLEQGQTLSLGYGAAGPATITTTAAVSLGAQTIPINGFTPSQTYPVGTLVVDTVSLGVAITHIAPDPSLFAQTNPITAAAVTTTQTGADQFTYGARGIHVLLNMTSIGTGSVTMEIDGKDILGNYYTIISGNAITSIGKNLLKVYPGITSMANQAAADVLPAVFRILVTANNANPTTYTVTSSLLP